MSSSPSRIPNLFPCLSPTRGKIHSQCKSNANFHNLQIFTICGLVRRRTLFNWFHCSPSFGFGRMIIMFTETLKAMFKNHIDYQSVRVNNYSLSVTYWLFVALLTWAHTGSMISEAFHQKMSQREWSSNKAFSLSSVIGTNVINQPTTRRTGRESQWFMYQSQLNMATKGKHATSERTFTNTFTWKMFS